MNVPLTSSEKVLRVRFGEKLQAARQLVGYTQLDLAIKLDYNYPAQVSQVECGRISLPEHDLLAWAELLRLPPFDFGKSFLYHVRPNVYACMFGANPYDLEFLPRSEKAHR